MPMKTNDAVLFSPTDEIARLLLNVARRADELVRSSECEKAGARDYWKEAEVEVLAGWGSSE